MQQGPRHSKRLPKLGNSIAYVKKVGNTFRPDLKQPFRTGSTSLKLYQDCRVPLDIFLDCLFDKDYERLIIKGTCSEHRLLETWESIYVEYSNMLTEGSGNELYQKVIQINYLATKLFIVDKAVKHLRISFNLDLLNILNYYGVSNRITDKDTNAERCDKLDMVLKICRKWNTELDVLRKDYDGLQTEHSDKQGGREFFEDSLTGISTYRKYSVLEKDITVRQFVKSLKSMEQYAIKLATKQM